MKLIKQQNTKKYKYDGDKYDILENTTLVYYYDTEEERTAHKEEMENKGFEDSGQVKENTGSFQNPNYVWFGSYLKHNVSEVKKIKEQQPQTELFE